ncbi:MAG: BBE domain-containing protein [Solirubrobacteraceae bacterium]
MAATWTTRTLTSVTGRGSTTSRTIDRCSEVKARWDPTNTFHYSQSIRLP